MKRPAEPLFLARQGYRRRRLGDAARLLPVLGAVLFVMPLLGAGTGLTTAGSALYLFGVWLGLILAAAALGRHLRKQVGDAGAGAQDPP